MAFNALKNVPSLKDVASLACVSVSTAGNVMRAVGSDGRRNYSEQTAERVRAAANTLGYKVSRAARAMRTNRSGLIGFVSVNYSRKQQSVENFSIFPFLVGMNHVFSKTGKHVVLVELDEFELIKEGKVPSILKENFFDALVIQFGLSNETLAFLEDDGVPIIYWDMGASPRQFDSVYRSERRISGLLTQRLIDEGWANIAYSACLGFDQQISRSATHFSFNDRYAGYLASMEANGRQPHLLTGYDPESLARQIRDQGITAVVIQGNLDYGVILQALLILNRRLPGDFKVLACDVETSVVNRMGFLQGAEYNRYMVGMEVATMVLAKIKSGGRPVPSREIPVSFNIPELTGA